MSLPRSSQSIYSIATYIGGDVTPPGFVRRVVLASNENPYGPSKFVKKAVAGCVDKLQCYPSGAASDLRQAIGTTHELDPDWLLVGNGSEDILHLIARAFAGHGDEVIIPQYGFGVYKIATLAVGAVPVFVPRVDFKLTVDSIMVRVNDRTKILYLDHPGNPIAYYLTNDEIEELLERIPENVLVVFDSAYAEYMDFDDFHPGTKWVKKYPNVVMVRSFSKAYAMGNLRLGWLYAHPEIIDPIHRVRPPFNTTGVSQAAGIAALADQEWLDHCVSLNKNVYHKFFENMDKLDIHLLPFFSNFVMARFDDAAAVHRYLGERGIIVRPMVAYDLPDYLRITIGKDEEMEELVAMFRSCPVL